MSVTFLPMVFMFIITYTASWELMGIFRKKASTASSDTEALTYKIDAFLVLLMASLAIIVLIDLSFKLYRYLSGKVNIAGPEEAS